MLRLLGEGSEECWGNYVLGCSVVLSAHGGLGEGYGMICCYMLLLRFDEKGGESLFLGTVCFGYRG